MSASTPESNNQYYSSIEDYLAVIRSGSGADLEELAGEVPQDKIPLLVGYYYHTQHWDEKSAIVELLRFDEHSDLPAMMLDFLRAPKEFHDDDSKEYILMAKAFALRFMGAQYDIIEDYSDNLNLICRDTAQVLDERGLNYYPLDKTSRDEIARKQYQAKEEQRYLHKKTPQEQLIFAIEQGSLDRAKIALRHQADVNALITEGDCKGMSMLMFAISRATLHHKLDVVHLLLDEGADIDVIRQIRPSDDPDKGQTALWWAADLGDEALVRRLLDAGALPNIPDQHDYTPRLAALYVKHQHIADILQEAESKIVPKATSQETLRFESNTSLDNEVANKNSADKEVKPERNKLVIGILVSCLLFSFGAGCYQLKEHLTVQKNRQLLDESGVITDAVIFDTKHSQRISQSSNNHTKSTTNSYSVNLRFDANSEEGTTRQGMMPDYREIIHSVGESTYKKAYTGNTMDIKYLPDDPNIYEVLKENGEYAKSRLLYFAIGLLLLAGFLIFQLRMYYKTGKTW